MGGRCSDRRTRGLTALAAGLLALPLLAAAAPAQRLTFIEGFEPGPGAWPGPAPPQPRPAPTSCAGGPAISGLAAGDLGPAPPGPFAELTCLEIVNDRDEARDGETAYAAIPLPRRLAMTGVDELVLVGPGDRRLAAQFDVLARWGGAVDDPTLPIRWLQVAVEPRLGPRQTVHYALRRHAPPPPPAADPFAAAITPQDGGYAVDTGVATFLLEPTNPALFARIAIDPDGDGPGRLTVYRHAPQAGPSLTFRHRDRSLTLDVAGGGVAVDPGGFAIVERGPVKVVVSLDGHFTDGGGASLCTRDGLRYERFGYTLVATFYRGRRDVGLEYHLRNECSDGFGGSWTDDAVTIERAAWSFPLLLAPAEHFVAGAGAVAAAATSTASRVEQRRGGGDPWRRRARLLRDGIAAEHAEAFAEPLIAVAGERAAAALQLAWMRFREPQALVAEGAVLRLEVVGEDLVLGEGKGLWNAARLAFVPRPADDGELLARLERERRRGALALERGLLVRAPRGWIDGAGLYPSLGTAAPSAFKSAYLEVLDALHRQTTGDGGQWQRAKTYGSQLWPDVQFDLWQIDHPDPFANDVVYNYWSPSGVELFEYLRSGEPRWAWDFALPQAWLQLYTAYLNVGDQRHSNRNGLAVTSGGSGEGHWHRRSGGSDDYTYDVGHELAYLLRPSPALRRRFAQAGRTVVERYALPKAQETARERFVDQVDVTRQVIQHFEMLMNCADFVPGATGRDCQTRLHQLLAELTADNLAAGVFCQGDVPSPARCAQPQQFMQAAMHHRFFHRYLLAYGHLPAVDDVALRRALSRGPWLYYQEGMAKGDDGRSIDVLGDWAAQLDCRLTAGGTAVAGCSWVANGDGPALLWPNKPHVVALLLVAHQLDPSLALCDVAKAALDDPDLAATWQDFLGNDSGWWKGAAQMLQGAVFAAGGYDACRDP